MRLSGGERCERCRWQEKRAERVAAVEKFEDQRMPDESFGYRNRVVATAVARPQASESVRGCFSAENWD